MKLDLKSTVIKTKGEVAKKKRREEGVAGGGWGEGAGLCKELSCVALHESGQLHSGGKTYERNPNEALLPVKPGRLYTLAPPFTHSSYISARERTQWGNQGTRCRHSPRRRGDY